MGYFLSGCCIKGRNKLRSCARHGQGYLKMKKLILSFAIIAGVSAAVIGLCSFTSEKQEVTETTVHSHIHVASQGAHCSGSVGCDCSGFSPITNGKEWQKEYCRHCGHKRSCHK